MRCDACGGQMLVSREDYHYAACGLPHVVLRDLEVRRCLCGEVEVVIPRIAHLHRALADAVSRSPVWGMNPLGANSHTGRAGRSPVWGMNPGPYALPFEGGGRSPVWGMNRSWSVPWFVTSLVVPPYGG